MIDPLLVEPVPAVDGLLQRASHALLDQSGQAPLWCAAAPGRVNLIGEHTDYNGGPVLPIAIDRVCVMAAAPTPAGAPTRLHALDVRQSAQFDAGVSMVVRAAGGPGTGIERGSWPSYIAGVFSQFQQLGPVPNLDVAIASSVPIGGGLSSSAAIEVAAATILEQATGRTLTPIDKALLCQRAEHEFAGVPCGIMDQFVSVMGQRGRALLIECRDHSTRPVPLPSEDKVAVVVIDSRVRHSLASGEYARRRAACEAAAGTLGVPALAGIGPADLASALIRLDDEQARCVRHVVTETGRTRRAAQALEAGDLAGVGELLRGSHASLRDDYRVSCPELDTLVDLACGVDGVFGARMTGGGFGGCIVALARPGAVAPLASAVRAGYRRTHGRDCTVFLVRASDGARPLNPPGCASAS